MSSSTAVTSEPTGGMPMPAAAAVPTPAPAAQQPAEIDLLSDILGTSAPAQPTAAPTQSAAAPPAGGGGMDSMLMDLLGSGPSPAAPQAAAAPPVDAVAAMMGGANMMGSPMGGMGASPAPPAAGGFAPFSAFNKHGLLVMFACAKDASNPSVTTIDATFTNSNTSPIDGLHFQVAVPKYMKLQMSPASATTVPPNNMGSATQTFKVANSLHGQKPVVIRVKVDFSSGGQQVSETGQVDSFPPGI